PRATTKSTSCVFHQVAICVHRPSVFFFFFSSRRRHTRSVSAFLLNRSSDLSKRRISGMALLILALLQRIFLMSSLMLLLVWLIFLDRKSGSAGMPRPISYAVFCLKKKKESDGDDEEVQARLDQRMTSLVGVVAY